MIFYIFVSATSHFGSTSQPYSVPSSDKPSMTNYCPLHFVKKPALMLVVAALGYCKLLVEFSGRAKEDPLAASETLLEKKDGGLGFQDISCMSLSGFLGEASVELGH
ncbi:hypothetical protein Dimus_028773 [Dionaea muscipula]